MPVSRNLTLRNKGERERAVLSHKQIVLHSEYNSAQSPYQSLGVRPKRRETTSFFHPSS